MVPVFVDVVHGGMDPAEKYALARRGDSTSTPFSSLLVLVPIP